MEFPPSYEEVWEAAYNRGPTPFDLEGPLPWVVTLATDGRIRGRVLDAGCGGGHNTLYLARLGFEVVGVDVAPSAISRARHKAGQQGVRAEFTVDDLVNLADRPSTFDTVIDIGCFHSLQPEDRARYASALHAACRPGARLHLRCFTDSKQQGPPGIGTATGLSASDLEQSFSGGWSIENLTAAADHVVPENHRWSGSRSTGRRLNHGDRLTLATKNTAQFWYATVARRP